MCARSFQETIVEVVTGGPSPQVWAMVLAAVASSPPRAAACPSCGGSRRYRVWSAADGKRPGGWCRECGLYDDPISAYRTYLVPGSGFFDAVRYYALLLGLPTPDFGSRAPGKKPARSRRRIVHLHPAAHHAR